MNEFIDQKFTNQENIPAAFSHSSFENCIFTGYDFKPHDLTHTRFIDCIFNSCDISNVNLSNARMRGVQFESCKLMGIQWPNLDDLVGPIFKNCNLSYSNFIGMKLKKSILSNCIMKEVDFYQADLTECDLSFSDLQEARFQETILIKANFQHAFNYQIDPITNKVRGAHFNLAEAIGLLTGLGIVIVDN